MHAGFLGFKGDEGGRSSVAEARVGRWYGHSGREGLERVPHRGETLFYGAHINSRGPLPFRFLASLEFLPTTPAFYMYMYMYM